MTSSNSATNSPTSAKPAIQPEIQPAVVCVGDELILGEFANSNMQWMCQRLWQTGHKVGLGLCLPDEVEVIASWVKRAREDGHFPILVSGGIGGTHDDRTRQGLALATGRKLTVHPECFQILQQRYGERFTEQRQRMAHLPEGCGLIPNEHGAPGFHMDGIYAFPGFPYMMQAMVEHLLPHLIPTEVRQNWVSVEKTYSITEGEIALTVEDFLHEFPQARVGIYPNADPNGRKEIKLVLRCPANLQQCAQRLDYMISAHLPENQGG